MVLIKLSKTIKINAYSGEEYIGTFLWSQDNKQVVWHSFDKSGIIRAKTSDIIIQKLNVSPEDYSNNSMYQQRVLIKKIKREIGDALSVVLNAPFVEGPLIVTPESMINDHLDGKTKPVTFDTPTGPREIVQSTAKWKRLSLIGAPEHAGLIVDMKAIRPEEQEDIDHTYYVDQWDWEVRIPKKDRNVDVLFDYARKVYTTIRNTAKKYGRSLPEHLTLIRLDSAEAEFKLTGKPLEDKLVAEFGSIFIWAIDKDRAYDYDDWTMNGDIIVGHQGRALELSSMAIRVSRESLLSQARVSGTVIPESEYHKGILNEELPFSIGGGIGQSRVLMFILGEKTIKDVQLF